MRREVLELLTHILNHAPADSFHFHRGYEAEEMVALVQGVLVPLSTLVPGDGMYICVCVIMCIYIFLTPMYMYIFYLLHTHTHTQPPSPP